jgi:hypothetical protein
MVPRKLFFLHIPKTAGTSFVETVRPWFPSSHPVDLKMLDNDDILAANNFVWGHITYDRFRAAPASEEFLTAVALREPYARLASHLQYTDRYNEPAFAEELTRLPAGPRDAANRIANVDLNDAGEIARFLDDMTPWEHAAYCDLQVRYLTDAPRPPDFLPRINVTADHTEKAIFNLESFDFVMCTDALDIGVREIAMAFDKPEPQTAARINRGLSGRRVNVHNPAIRQALAPCVKSDLKLYEYVLGMRAVHSVRERLIQTS